MGCPGGHRGRRPAEDTVDLLNICDSLLMAQDPLRGHVATGCGCLHIFIMSVLYYKE